MALSMMPRARRLASAAVGLALLVGPARLLAQQATGTLTLEEAIELARRNNPGYLSQKNDNTAAEWAVREAYGGLLPSASASLGMQYQAEGTPQLGIFTGQDLGLGGGQSYYYSDYNLSLSYRLSGSTFFNISRQRANRTASAARTVASRAALDADVTKEYLLVIAASDAVDLAHTELERAEQNLRLARARVEVGDAIELEAKQAEVERGRAEVTAIKAENDLQTTRLALTQLLGTEIDPNVELTTQFEVFEPGWTADALIQRAMAANPTLNANRASEHASSAAVRAARSTYLPTLDVSLGWSGYTREAGHPDLLVQQTQSSMESNFEQCGFYNQIAERLTSPLPGFPLDCSQYLPPADLPQQVISSNNAFPFNFSRQPWTLQARVSLPIFSGFSRQSQVEQARATADDAVYRRRAAELQLRTDITTALNNLRTAYRTVGIEERNSTVADEQLKLARERYRLGMTSFVDLIDAEALKARADRDYLQARYTFHESFATLENAVGEPLQTSGAPR